MQVKTLLNRVHPIKKFVYKSVRMGAEGTRKYIVAEVIPRKNSRPVCSGCSKARPGYDTCAHPRRFEFVPLWGYKVYLEYRMRRVDCPDCGVRTEKVPWADGKSPVTNAFRVHLARWARRLSWKETAETFRTSWDNVRVAVRHVVAYGLAHRRLEGMEAIGVDEIHWGKGNRFLTLVYQIDEGRRRLLHVAEKRREDSLLDFFRMLGPELSSSIRYVCSDMWRPYINVIAKMLPRALHILDRFHIVSNLGKAVDEVRAEEARRMSREGKGDVLKHTKYCFLKNPENLTANQQLKLRDVLLYDLKSVRAYRLKDAFQSLWDYKSPYWAEWYLKKWCARAMRSKLNPIKKFVRSIRKHQPLILNYFKARKRFSSGVVEGMNRKVKVTTAKAYGYRTYDAIELALYHNLGNLKEPDITHEFF